VYKPLFLPLFIAIASVLISSCGGSKDLVTVVLEDSKGNTELIYTGSAVPTNMVREVRFNPHGDSLSVTPLQEGVLHGDVITFHPNGKRKELVTYAEGKQNGRFIAYDLEGVIAFDGTLKDGKKHGLWSYWYDETQMKQQCPFENDILTGKCSFWYIDGNLKREETYSAGKLIASQDF